MTDAARSPIAAPSAGGQPTLSNANRWATGKATPVIGAAHKQAIVTLAERKSGYALLVIVSHKSANLVGRSIGDKFKDLCSRVKTLTVDNGKEFADHPAIVRAQGIQTYFADSFSSWQRGSNENFNGLLRQYIPKKRRLETVTD